MFWVTIDSNIDLLLTLINLFGVALFPHLSIFVHDSLFCYMFVLGKFLACGHFPFQKLAGHMSIFGRLSITTTTTTMSYVVHKNWTHDMSFVLWAHIKPGLIKTCMFVVSISTISLFHTPINMIWEVDHIMSSYLLDHPAHYAQCRGL